MVEADLSLAQAEGDPGDGASIRGELLLDGVEVGVVEEPGILGVGPAVAAVEHGERSALFVDVVERDPRRQCSPPCMGPTPKHDQALESGVAR
jgi:hypothetical protein